MEEIEEWRPVVGYEGYYEVSSLGRVRSVDRNINNTHYCSKVIKQHIDRYGYNKVVLSIHGKSKTTTAHRLVAKTFISNPKNKPQVNHIDFNRTNNTVKNLEWVSASENTLHSMRHGRFDPLNCPFAPQLKRTELKPSDIYNIRKLYNNRVLIKEIQRMYPSSSFKSIKNICGNRSWHDPNYKPRPRVRFTADQITEIINLKGKMTIKQIAAKFNVSTTHACRIVNGFYLPHKPILIDRS